MAQGEFERNGFDGDVPVPEIKAASSIGSLKWPPTDHASNERKKGIHGHQIVTSDSLTLAMSDFSHVGFNVPGEDGYDSTLPDCTRISGRILIANDLVPALNPWRHLIEPIVPLQGCGIERLDNSSIVYLGNNHQTRRTPLHIIEQHRETVRNIYFGNGQPSSPAKRLPQEILIRPLSMQERQSEEILEQFVALYAPFGYELANIVEMFNSPSNTIMVAIAEEASQIDGTEGSILLNRGEVLSSAILEEAIIPFQLADASTVDFRMVEITDATTKQTLRKDYRLFTQVADASASHLVRNCQAPNIYIGESNTDAYGIIKIAHHQGRNAAIETAEALGYPDAFFLQQHVKIRQHSDDQREPGYYYNDLMPTWLTQKELIKRYG